MAETLWSLITASCAGTGLTWWGSAIDHRSGLLSGRYGHHLHLHPTPQEHRNNKSKTKQMMQFHAKQRVKSILNWRATRGGPMTLRVRSKVHNIFMNAWDRALEVDKSRTSEAEPEPEAVAMCGCHANAAKSCVDIRRAGWCGYRELEPLS